MNSYSGSCHCGAVTFSFQAPAIDRGFRCNCSLCVRKGALMSAFTVAPEDISIDTSDDQLGLYQFGSCVAKHYFCRTCGIYPLHETLRMPGHFRINLGCVEDIDPLSLDVEIIDGKNLF